MRSVVVLVEGVGGETEFHWDEIFVVVSWWKGVDTGGDGGRSHDGIGLRWRFFFLLSSSQCPDRNPIAEL